MALTVTVSDYTKTPGGRHRSEGPYSGEDFRDKILRPNFERAIEDGIDLIIDLDGGYGYSTSFLEEAFGGLARETKNKKVMEIKIKSDEEPALIEKIKSYIQDALR